ncbi:MAG TPA: glycosyltransferase family 4 protein [Micromonosporaceae bacterium]|nr:glycosyltransferase family 4 protein [Micromonosporaceae bacterium]
MPPTHVMFLNWRDTSHPEAGGSERYVEQLASGLVAQGHQVSVHCAGHSGASRVEERDGVRFVRRGGRLTVYPHGLAAVVRERPDIVIDVQNHVPFFSVLAHRRVVVVVHHVGRDQWAVTFGRAVSRIGWWVESWLTPRLYRRARYVAVSGATRDDLVALGVDAERIDIVHNVADPPPAGLGPVARAARPTICVLARLMPHKQVDHAIEVLARLVPDHPDLRLRIVGEGPVRAALAAQAADLGLADRIDFLGWLEEPAKHRVLAGSWLLLCPSLKEGWGRVVMEAAVHGVPTVAYRHAGGLAESVRDGVTGLLADDLEELAKHCAWLLDHEAERTALGRAAREHAATFTLERALAELGAVLARVSPGWPAGR